jgi:type IV pilus assembly PilM-like protein
VWWHKKGRDHPGWVALTVTDRDIRCVYSHYDGAGTAEVLRLAAEPIEDPQDLAKSAKQLDLGGHQCTTVLRPGDYQLLVLDAPNVPQEELRAAIRWRIKDMIDYHLDDATVDVLDIPVDKAASGRARSMFAAAARNDVIEACVQKFQAAGIPLSVIDIPETAQRNIASFYEDKGRGVAMLYLGEETGLLTVSYSGELYVSRRLDIPLAMLTRDDGQQQRDEVLNRILLELQRTLDHLERQYPWVIVTKLLIAPEPTETGLAEFLRSNLDIAVVPVDLRDKIAFADTNAEPGLQWQLFHLIGASLRHEAKAL